MRRFWVIWGIAGVLLLLAIATPSLADVTEPNIIHFQGNSSGQAIIVWYAERHLEARIYDVTGQRIQTEQMPLDERVTEIVLDICGKNLYIAQVRPQNEQFGYRHFDLAASSPCDDRFTSYIPLAVEQ